MPIGQFRTCETCEETDFTAGDWRHPWRISDDIRRRRVVSRVRSHVSYAHVGSHRGAASIFVVNVFECARGESQDVAAPTVTFSRDTTWFFAANKGWCDFCDIL